MIYAIRISGGQERYIIDSLEKKLETFGLDIRSISYLKTVKGYIFIEFGEEEDLLKLLEGVRGIKSILRTEVKIEELIPHLEKKEVRIDISEGDIVEFIKGGFKGEQAKVVRVEKDNVVVEPLDVAVSIPITTKLSYLRLVKKAEVEEGE